MDSFSHFSNLVAQAGLTAIDHGNGHWHIKGGIFEVHYYPCRGTIYVNGTHRGKRGSSIAEAIKAASQVPAKAIVPVGRKGGDWRRRMREKLWRKQHGLCHWCHGQMLIGSDWINHDDYATIDHRIPLGRGGTNGDDNLVLSHYRCNHGRGNDMPEVRRQRQEAAT